MTTLKKFSIYHLPALLYAGVIITLSSIPGLAGPQLRYLAFDKLAHFVEYAVFSYLIFRSFSNLSAHIKTNLSFVLSTSMLICFALFDEFFVQSISNRHSNIYDLLTDFIGGFLVLILLKVMLSNKKKKSRAESA